VGLGKYSIVFLALLLLSHLCFAQLFVDVSPKQLSGQKTTVLYNGEVSDYRITVFNSTAESFEDLSFKIVVGESLSLLDGLTETKILVKTLPLVEAGQQQVIDFSVKAGSPSPLQEILVYYGQETYEKVTGAYVVVTESPVSIEAEVSSPVIGIAGNGFVSAKIKNNSEHPLQNLRAELVLPQEITRRGPDLLIEVLPPGVETSEKKFEFDLKPLARGEHPIALKVSFEDSNGSHVFEKLFTITIQDLSLVPLAVIILLAAVIIIALLFKGKKKDVEEEPAEKVTTVEKPPEETPVQE